MTEALETLNASGWYIYQLWQHGPRLGFEVILRQDPGLISRGRGNTIDETLWDAWAAIPEPHSGEWDGIAVNTEPAKPKGNLLQALGLETKLKVGRRTL